MYGSQRPWVDLYESLRDYEGGDAVADLLEPWPEAHADECRWLAAFAARTDWRGADDEALCRLYAAFRVTSLLLLRFQHGDRDWEGPAVTVSGFVRFHQALGFHIPDAPSFHPFFHEIVGVRQAVDLDAPIEVVEEIWPALMLGGMMFCRAGTVVSGGAAHVVKEIAECGTLYWAFRRRDRPCQDLSHGWGSNSQWRTWLRRDYQTPAGFHYNVDGAQPLGATGRVDGVPAEAMRELVRHRCLIRTAIDDPDLYPYPHSLQEPAAPG